MAEKIVVGETAAETQVRAKGLTWRSLLAIVFGALIVQPVAIYASLVTGQMPSLYHWAVILLWVELAGAFGSMLTKQEMFIISSIAPMVVTTAGFTGGWQQLVASTGPAAAVNLIQRMYIGTTDIAKAMGISEAIPSWWAPPPSIALEVYRTKWVFLHPAWIEPIVITVAIIFITLIANISMGFFNYEIYVAVEKLEFPAATAQADTLVALAEREPTRLRVLMFAAVMGLIYGLIYSFLPMLGMTPTTIMDFTPFLIHSLPGATFGFSMNLADYLPGFILPLPVTIAQFIGAFAFYFIGTYLITAWGLWPEEAHPEMMATWSITDILNRANLYFYTSALIGISIALATVPFILRPQTLVSAFSKLAKASTGGVSRLYVLLAMFFAASLAEVALVHYLVPNFPLYILFGLIVAWSFFASFVATNASGVTFGGFNIPYMRELIIYSSGYQGKDVWFAPITVFTGGSSIASMLKQADVVQADHMEYIKALVIVTLLMIASGFLWTELFWYVQPFPASSYPWTVYYWPQAALNFCRMQTWMWTGYLFNYNIIATFFVVGAVIYVVTYFLKVPSLLVAMLAGAGLGIPIALAQLIASIITHFVILKFIPLQTWFRYRNLIVIGFMVGGRIAATIPAALNLMMRSMWLLPY